MKLLMYGLSVDELPELEKTFYNLSNRAQQAMAKYIQNISGVFENFIFQNNHTFEVFLFVDENEFQHGDLLRYFAEIGQLELKDVIFYSYSYFNEEAINYLYKKVFGTDRMSPIKFFNDFVENAIRTNHASTLGEHFNTLFNHLLQFMFDDSIELQMDYNVASQLLTLISCNKLGDYSNKNVVILGADLNSLYLSYCLKHYGVRSVTLTELEDSNFLHIVNEMKKLNFNYFNHLFNYSIKLANIDQTNYQFAQADLFVNLIIGWSNLKNKIARRISEVRMTPKRVTYASFYTDDSHPQFEDHKLSLPRVDDTLLREEDVLEKIQIAAENTLKEIFDIEHLEKF